MQRLSLCYLTRFQSVATGDVVFYLSLSFCAFCANNQYALYVCLNLSTKSSSSLLRSLLFSQNQLSQIRRGINFIVQSSIRARTSLLFFTRLENLNSRFKMFYLTFALTSYLQPGLQMSVCLKCGNRKKSRKQEEESPE